MSQLYCPLCNTSFGTAEPKRWTGDRKAVHERCVFAKGRKDAFVDVCVGFLRENVGLRDAAAFATRVRGTSSPGTFASVLSRAIRPAWQKARGRAARKRFKDFASRIGGQLTYDVTLPASSRPRLQAIGSDD